MEKKEHKSRRIPIKKKADETGLTAPERLKVLFTIVNRSKTEFYLDLIGQYEVNMHHIVFGHGTAPSNLGYLVGDQEKAIIISVIKEERTHEILNALEERFQKVKNGKGIAYTVPISSVIGVTVYRFLSNNRDQIKKGN